MLDGLAEAMRIGMVAVWWYLATAAVTVGTVVGAVAMGRRRG